MGEEGGGRKVLKINKKSNIIKICELKVKINIIKGKGGNKNVSAYFG